MKLKFSLLVSLVIIHCNISVAQVEDQKSDVNRKAVTSITQIKDAEKGAAYYEDLKYLIESVGCVSGDIDGNFRANKAVTKAYWAIVTNAAMDRINEYMVSSIYSIDKVEMRSRFEDSLSTYWIKTFSTVKETELVVVNNITDINTNSDYYFAVASLIERYRQVWLETLTTFEPELEVTNNLYKAIYEGTTGLTFKGNETGLLTRGDYIINIANWMRYITADINAKIKMYNEKTKSTGFNITKEKINAMKNDKKIIETLKLDKESQENTEITLDDFNTDVKKVNATTTKKIDQTQKNSEQIDNELEKMIEKLGDSIFGKSKEKVFEDLANTNNVENNTAQSRDNECTIFYKGFPIEDKNDIAFFKKLIADVDNKFKNYENKKFKNQQRRTDVMSDAITKIGNSISFDINEFKTLDEAMKAAKSYMYNAQIALGKNKATCWQLDDKISTKDNYNFTNCYIITNTDNTKVKVRIWVAKYSADKVDLQISVSDK